MVTRQKQKKNRTLSTVAILFLLCVSYLANNLAIKLAIVKNGDAISSLTIYRVTGFGY